MRTRMTGFLALGRRLATTPEDVVQLQTLREALDVPPSTFHAWVRQLRFHRVLTPTARGDRVDRPGLLAYHQAHRVARTDPVLDASTSLAAPEVSAAFTRAGIRHALCMRSAANAWAFFEPRRTTEVYVDRRDVPRIRGLLPPGDLELRCFHENLDDLPVQPRDGRPVTDVFLTVVDCRAHPEGGAYADFVDRNVLMRSARS